MSTPKLGIGKGGNVFVRRKPNSNAERARVLFEQGIELSRFTLADKLGITAQQAGKAIEAMRPQLMEVRRAQLGGIVWKLNPEAPPPEPPVAGKCNIGGESVPYYERKTIIRLKAEPVTEWLSPSGDKDFIASAIADFRKCRRLFYVVREKRDGTAQIQLYGAKLPDLPAAHKIPAGKSYRVEHAKQRNAMQ